MKTSISGKREPHPRLLKRHKNIALPERDPAKPENRRQRHSMSRPMLLWVYARPRLALQRAWLECERLPRTGGQAATGRNSICKALARDDISTGYSTKGGKLFLWGVLWFLMFHLQERPYIPSYSCKRHNKLTNPCRRWRGFLHVFITIST